MRRKHNIDGYDESLDRAVRRAGGIYYTPNPIVVDMLSTVDADPESLSDKLFLDPCCGEGRFLVEAVKMGFRAENIYGYDTDPKAARRARQRIKELTGFDARYNIRCENYLRVAQRSSRRYDYIFTNPPWGSHMSADERNKWGQIYGAGRSLDSSALILFAALRSAREGGVVSFLLPEAFFNIGNFEDARREVLSHRVLHLRDYGKPFFGLMTRAQAVTLRNERSSGEVECRYGDEVYMRRQSSFESAPKSIMNFWASREDEEFIAALYAKPHITLAGRARWGMGIVTGDNAKYCVESPRDGYIGVVRGQDIHPDGELRAELYIPCGLSQYQQSAEEDFYLAREKIIYRFISNRLLFRLDREQNYMLNSANALILDGEIAKYGEGVAAMLSSDVMNRLFRLIFRTHKILRGDLERLPIHIEYLKQCGDFSIESYLKYLGLK